MAERRMIAKTIVTSDAFLDLPATARCLYFTLAVLADDDGFINSPRSVMRQVGASQDDLSILLVKKFLIAFDDGVVVIKHWRIHNYIQSDRYKPTVYTDHLAELSLDENKAYTQSENDVYPICIQDVSEVYPQDRIGKDRKGKDREKAQSARITPPTVDEVRAYCTERKNHVDPETFVDFYASKGWKIGKNSVKDWKACVRTWERRGGDPIGSRSEHSDLIAKNVRRKTDV